jgi:hypothetical protein
LRALCGRMILFTCRAARNVMSGKNDAGQGQLQRLVRRRILKSATRLVNARALYAGDRNRAMKTTKVPLAPTAPPLAPQGPPSNAPIAAPPKTKKMKAATNRKQPILLFHLRHLKPLNHRGGFALLARLCPVASIALSPRS